MTRKIALLFASTMMFTAVACDSAEESVEDRAAEATDAPDQVGAKRGHHGKFNPTEKLCAEIECSDAQAAQIDELFASRHDSRGGPDKADHEARKAARADAHKAIADAFRADEFDLSVLERVASPNPEHDGGDREAKMIELATELHAILTPVQRAKLADKIQEGGLMMFFGGHHGMRGHHGKGPRGTKDFAGEGNEGKTEGDLAAHLAPRVEGFCEPISCTDEQKAQLTATFQGLHEAHHEARAEREADKPDFTPLADAFRADTLDEAKLRTVLAEGKANKKERKAEHRKEFGGVIAEIHDILTPEQRAILADKIEADGLHSIMGGHGRGHHKGKRGKRGGHGHGEAEVDAG